ncbi:MAG TPA: ROK family protein [Trebonia sp.]|jgi:predicted NBD/HSP70 family sugar kinase|nr:ROK family protein [Trebonia sp.]
MAARGGTALVSRRSDALVLGMARQEQAVDRSALATRTGLTPQAVSNVLARLTSAGLLEPLGVRRSGVGKPPTMHQLRDTARQAVGAHVTRRGLRLTRVDLRGRVRSRLWYDLPRGFAPGAVLEKLRAGTRELRQAVHADGGDLVGVGIGMVGPLDQRLGVVRDAYGLEGWHDVPLRQLAEDVLGLPVLVDKDVSAAAAGQAWAQPGHDADTAVILIEAGVGAGLWLSGAVHRGRHTNAGEFGHTVIDLHGPRCVCGRDGCLEVVHDTALERGDVAGAASAIAVGALNIVEALDVRGIVLAGSDFLRHEEIYLGAVTDAINRYRPASDWRRVDVSAAAHGQDCVAAGAGAQILQQLYFSASPPDSGPPVFSVPAASDLPPTLGGAPEWCASRSSLTC